MRINQLPHQIGPHRRDIVQNDGLPTQEEMRLCGVVRQPVQEAGPPHLERLGPFACPAEIRYDMQRREHLIRG